MNTTILLVRHGETEWNTLGKFQGCKDITLSIEWRNDELNAPMCGRDLSLKKASLRAEKAILQIARKHQCKYIIIVAHGGIIKAGLIGIFAWKMTMYHKMVLDNTSVSKITFDDSFNPTIVTLNDTSHLPKKYSIKSFV